MAKPLSPLLVAGINLSALTTSARLSAHVEYVPRGSADGFQLHLSYVDRPKFSDLTEASYEISMDSKTGSPVRKLNSTTLLSRLIEEGCSGWTGLRYRHLPYLLPIDGKGLREQLTAQGKTEEDEVPFSKDLLLSFLRQAYGFEPWFTEALMNLSIYQAAREVTEAGNS